MRPYCVWGYKGRMGFSVQSHGPSAGCLGPECLFHKKRVQRGNTEDSLADRVVPTGAGPLYLVPAELHIGPVGSGLQAGVRKLQVHHLSTQVLLQAPDVSLQLGYLF